MLYAVVTGQRNHEDSKRKSAATRDGKARLYERGDPQGARIPDGYTLVVAPDGSKVVASEPRARPGHPAHLARAWDGAADSTIAAQLNEAGLRTEAKVTKSGPNAGRARWRALVAASDQQHAQQPGVRRPGDAARRRRRGQARGDHRDPARFDALPSLRSERGSKYRGPWSSRPGRTTDRFLLAKMATCARCGDRMYATGGQYVCANVHRGAGLCDAPKVNARASWMRRLSTRCERALKAVNFSTMSNDSRRCAAPVRSGATALRRACRRWRPTIARPMRCS
jgi:hypothetical protein